MVPPLTVFVTFAVPPLQPIEPADNDAVSALGWDMVTLAVAVQLFASVTVTLYVPALTPVRFWVLAEGVQLYVYGVVPPLTVFVTFDVPPLQPISPADKDAVRASGCEIVTLAVAVQEFASVTVTLYVPAPTPVRFWVLAEGDHVYV